MDPNETLRRIRELHDMIEASNDIHTIASLGVELAEYGRALDDWLVAGGFLPWEWRVKK